MHQSTSPINTAWLSESFGLSEPIRSTLLRAYTNDVFHINAGNGDYVLKVYGQGWRSLAAIRYEVELMLHLAGKGVPVVIPIAGRDHDLVHTLATGGATRYAVLYSWAAGRKPQPPFSLDLYYLEGQALAALHGASDDFRSHHTRPPLDGAYLLDRPLADILPHVADPDERRFLQRYVGQLRQRLGELAEHGLDWGPCHGDVTMDNFHLTDDGQIVWYDFDSGGPGWRAVDLQGWAALVPDAKLPWHAFLGGYQEVRQLHPINIEAAPVLAAVLEFWGVDVDVQRRESMRGLEAVTQYLTQSLKRSREWQTFLFPPRRSFA
jgi:Ser/Thr protein kinase RdoA (MazF antagonist)